MAAAAFVLSDGDHGQDRPSDVAAQEAPALPRLVADWLPEGYELADTVDETVGSHGIMSASPESDEVAALLSQAVERSVLFGEAGQADPLVNGGVDARTIRYVDGTPESQMDPVEGSEPVTVRGKPGGICSPPCVGENVTSITWREEPLLTVSLVSRTFDTDHLVQLADSLSFDGDYAVLASPPAEFPPLEEVGRAERPWSGDAPFNTARYVLAGPPPETALTVSVKPGDLALDRAQNAFVGADQGATDVTVRGHQGRLMTFGSGDQTYQTYRLVWEEAPGVLVTIDVALPGLTEDDVLQVAESLREATYEEWAATYPPAG
jgi:hypothetical protein